MSAKDIQLFEYYLPGGYIFLNKDPSLISTVVGSSVAVSLWDEKKKYGGMANFLYPYVRAQEEATSQYGNAALQYLIKMLREAGTKDKDLKAQIFGGAEAAAHAGARIARDNILVARKALRKYKIAVVSEDVGGHLGRKIVFNSLKNEAIVYKVNSLRISDWYPYQQGRDEGR